MIKSTFKCIITLHSELFNNCPDEFCGDVAQPNINFLDSKQVLSVIEKYSGALELLDAYDHQNMQRPKGNEATYKLDYKECMQAIRSMR